MKVSEVSHYLSSQHHAATELELISEINQGMLVAIMLKYSHQEKNGQKEDKTKD